MQMRWTAAYLGLALVPALTLGSLETAAQTAVQAPCSPRTDVLGHLAKKYGEGWRTKNHGVSKLAPAT